MPKLVLTLMEVLLIGERGMDGGDAVEEEGADDATAGDDVSHLAPRHPVALHPLMWNEPRRCQRGQGLLRRQEEAGGGGGGGGGQPDGGGEEAGGGFEEAWAEARSRIRETSSGVKVRGSGQEVST